MSAWDDVLNNKLTIEYWTHLDHVSKDIDSDKIYKAQLMIIGSLAAAGVISLIALGLAWFVVFDTFFKCQHRLKCAKDKIDLAEQAIAKRQISPTILEELGLRAGFDMKTIEKEITDFLEGRGAVSKVQGGLQPEVGTSVAK